MSEKKKEKNNENGNEMTNNGVKIDFGHESVEML